jgi:hypothetical protein
MLVSRRIAAFLRRHVDLFRRALEFLSGHRVLLGSRQGWHIAASASMSGRAIAKENAMGQLKAGIIPVTPFQQNCTILFDEETLEGVVVDPGGDVDTILAAIDDNG